MATVRLPSLWAGTGATGGKASVHHEGSPPDGGLHSGESLALRRLQGCLRASGKEGKDGDEESL